MLFLVAVVIVTRGKRPQMGEAARKHADIVYVTDDNPRSEDPAKIRQDAIVAVPDAIEVPDRVSAIEVAISTMSEGDVLLVAGKGHETGQIIGDRVIPFSDQKTVLEIVGRGEIENDQ